MTEIYQHPVLNERQKTYGSFASNAQISQNIKMAMEVSPNWKDLTASQAECLHMIATKIGRILTGNPHYADSWKDIAGYAHLVEHQLSEKT